MSAMRAPLGKVAPSPMQAPRPRPVPSGQGEGATGRAPSRKDLYSRDHKPLGDPAPLACTVAKAALETVLGSPAINPLIRWLTPDVRESLAQQHSLARRAGKTGPATVTIKRARVCRVTARAAEVSIVALCDGRARAIAMRLEDQSGRWLVTVLDVG